MGEFADKLAAYNSDPACLRAYLGSLESLKSSNLENYYKLLTDFDFIAAKVNHFDFGVQSLIDDYDLIDNSELNQEKIQTLRLIQETLRLSAHVLQKDKRQLATQFWGRMQSFAHTEIQTMLEVAKQRQVLPWLRPLTTSFTPPDGRLRRTLIGHSDLVRAIAVTPDGEYVISGSGDNTIKIWDLQSKSEITSFTGESSIRCCTIALYDLTIVAGEASGRLHYLRLKGITCV